MDSDINFSDFTNLLEAKQKAAANKVVHLQLLRDELNMLKSVMKLSALSSAEAKRKFQSLFNDLEKL